MRYRDREAAGRGLAEALGDLRGKPVVVLGLPRGGVAVARPVADALGAPLDVRVARKIGTPANPELAIGAVTARGTRVLNNGLLRALALPPGYLERETEAQRGEAAWREERLRGGRPVEPLAGRIAVLVDDGIATGMTMFAAIEEIRAEHPAELVVAVPVGAPEAIAELEKRVDRLVVLEVPQDFMAVGEHYVDFAQVDDETVRALLAARPVR